MTTNVVLLSRTGGGSIHVPSAVAAGPSGGYYVAGVRSGIVLLARLASTGALVWAKDVDTTFVSAGVVAMASSANRLAVAATNGFGTVVVMLFDDTGSLVWESVLNASSVGMRAAEGLVVGSDNSVYIVVSYDGPVAGATDYALLKLSPSAGTITWQVALTETSATGSPSTEFSQMVQMSGGDLLLSLYGPGSTAGERGHLQRVSSADGSIVWTRKINWGSGSAVTFVGLDGSDNIYACGQGYAYGSSGNELPVVKMASDGSLTWTRHVRRPSGAYTPEFTILSAGLTADASAGVHICGVMEGGDFGHVTITAAGTIASAAAPVSTYVLQYPFYVGAQAVGPRTQPLLLYADSFDAGSETKFVLVDSAPGSGDDATYSGIARSTVGFDVIAGSATVSTPSWTRAADPSFSLASDLGVSVSSGSLTSSFTPPAFTCAATSLGVVTQYGQDAYLLGYTVAAAPFAVIGSNIIVSRSYPNVGLTPPSTTFGTAVATRQQRATALGPTSNFGTPAYEPNTTRAADSLGIVLAGIGTPFATLGIAPEPSQRASSLGPTARVGTPTATNVLAVQASGSLFTVFGTASARLTQVATGLEPGAQFGTAKVTMSRRASGFLATQLGTPRIVLYGFPSGFQRTQFGTPTVRAPRVCQASGFLATNFGSPSAGSWVLHARSAYFRTRFGLPQAERTAPP